MDPEVLRLLCLMGGIFALFMAGVSLIPDDTRPPDDDVR